MKIVKLSCKISEDNRPIKIIQRSNDLYELFKDYFDEDTLHLSESVWACFMNSRNEVIGLSKISEGGISATVMDIRLIFINALNIGAVKLALAHNHPSGSRFQSKQDEYMTNKVSMASAFMDIELVDHIILYDNSYLSFSDEGILKTYNSEQVNKLFS